LIVSVVIILFLLFHIQLFFAASMSINVQFRQTDRRTDRQTTVIVA